MRTVSTKATTTTANTAIMMIPFSQETKGYILNVFTFLEFNMLQIYELVFVQNMRRIMFGTKKRPINYKLWGVFLT